MRPTESALVFFPSQRNAFPFDERLASLYWAFLKVDVVGEHVGDKTCKRYGSEDLYDVSESHVRLEGAIGF
jgi:hypothetical protein